MNYTYKQAYDEIIDAYFRDKILPLSASFCFCGTLSPTCRWRMQGDGIRYPYTIAEYTRMEDALFRGMMKNTNDCRKLQPKSPSYENDLFNGMCKALDELKRIHIERGEEIDENLILSKRQLTKII